MDSSSSPSNTAHATAGPRALTRILRLLDILAKKSEGLTLAELNTVLESPKSSLLNLLRPLVSDGYLLHSHGLYRLGPTAFRLAANIMSVWNFGKLVRPFLEELAARSGESVYIGVLDREEQLITYIDTIESAKSVRYSISVGATRPLYCTAAGRVLLAFAEQRWQEQFVRSGRLVRHTEFTTTDRSSLRSKLEEIRRTGISLSISEMFVGSAAISAPLYGADGQVAAAIAIGAPADRFVDQVDTFRDIILDVAKRASGVQVMGVDAQAPREKGSARPRASSRVEAS